MAMLPAGLTVKQSFTLVISPPLILPEGICRAPSHCNRQDIATSKISPFTFLMKAAAQSVLFVSG